MPSLSAEIFSIPLDKCRYLLYAPLRRAAFIGNARMVNFLADLQAGIYAVEADPDGAFVEFLRGIEILDADTEETLPITVFTAAPQPTVLSLFLTTACNLRCTYCYASAGDSAKKAMSFDVAKSGIDFVVANAVKRQTGQFQIAYHGGGEPSLNWRVMVQSLTYAQDKAAKLGLEISAGTATNGVLNNKQIDWIIANLQGVNLSCDGLPTVHDLHRRKINGTGSSEHVMHTMQRLDEADFRYGIRMTVTTEATAQLPASVEFLCQQFNPERIQIEPMYQLGRGRDSNAAENAAFVAAYRTASVCAKRYGQEILYSGARLDTLTNHFCALSQDNFCLSPNGNVSACYEAYAEDIDTEKLFFYGTPNPNGDGFIFDLAKLDHLRRQAVQHRPYCHNCFAKWHCAGDCYYKAVATHGLGEFSGTARCQITRELIQDQILERIVQAGGVFWREPPLDYLDFNDMF